MDLTLNADQEQLLGSIVDCLNGELPVSRLHEPEDRRERDEAPIGSYQEIIADRVLYLPRSR